MFARSILSAQLLLQIQYQAAFHQYFIGLFTGLLSLKIMTRTLSLKMICSKLIFPNIYQYSSIKMMPRHWYAAHLPFPSHLNNSPIPPVALQPQTITLSDCFTVSNKVECISQPSSNTCGFTAIFNLKVLLHEIKFTIKTYFYFIKIYKISKIFEICIFLRWI